MQAVTQRVGDVRDIAVPALVLHGGDDPLLPVDNGRRLGELIPDAVYVELPEVGHLIPWEAPDRTAALMREFLASARVGSG